MTHRYRAYFLRRAPSAAGFSILELLVTLGVFLVVSAMLIVSYRTYDSRFALDTEAQLAAQAIREAQVSAMSVRANTGGAFTRYGIRFDHNTPGTFVLFSDKNANSVYDPGLGTCGTSGTECEKIFTLRPKHRVAFICVEGAVGASVDCPVGQEEFNHVDIVFTRPNPDAVISGVHEIAPPGTQGLPNGLARARIRFENNRGHYRIVEVWQTGQISVQ